MSCFNTCLDYIYTNVIHTSIDLFLHEVGWCFVNAVHALGILRGQGRCGSHSIAAMSGDHLLIGFKASGDAYISSWTPQLQAQGETYAPPELSEPAMARIRFIVVVCHFSLYMHT